MSHELNSRMIEVQIQIAELDKSAKGDIEVWKSQIADGHDVLPHELLEADRYLKVLLEGENA